MCDVCAKNSYVDAQQYHSNAVQPSTQKQSFLNWMKVAKTSLLCLYTQKVFDIFFGKTMLNVYSKFYLKCIVSFMVTAFTYYWNLNKFIQNTNETTHNMIENKQINSCLLIFTYISDFANKGNQGP